MPVFSGISHYLEAIMKDNTVLVFTRKGMGSGPEDLQLTLATKFLALTLESGQLPSKILFYTDGVKLACSGSLVIDLLKLYEQKQVELVLCKTCLDFFGLTGSVQAGVVGGMGDIIETMQKADKVISL
jgi:sulfur relay (sulfurtransferase) complex TusBCD TusD component (DsrE family)